MLSIIRGRSKENMLEPNNRSSSRSVLSRSNSGWPETSSGTGGMAKAEKSLMGRLPRCDAKKGGTYLPKSAFTGSTTM